MDKILSYTDGSAVVKGEFKGYGGFGVYFPDLFGEKRAFSKGYTNTKTGRMEIYALLCAIRQIPIEYKGTLVVYSDSQYVVKTFTENRIIKWQKNNWEGIKNVDLWKKVLHELMLRPMRLEMRWQKAHMVDKYPERKNELLQCQNIRGNYIADFLACYKRHNIYQKDLN